MKSFKKELKIISKRYKNSGELAEEKYIEIMRKKSGEERLKIAFELRESVLKIARAAIKAANPKISSRQLNKKLQERIYGPNFSF